MKAYELISWLEEKYPASAAEEWDNVGLLVGSDEKEISHIFLALDLTEETLEEAIAAGADVYVTGDIDHHTGIDTVAQGLAIIDAGHYGTEYIFMNAMKKELKEAFSSLKVTCAEVKSPYTII